MKRILFYTGAGISADSGISTFRNNEDGLWTKYDPMVVANIQTFESNRELTFKFYNERRVALPSVQPNKAHTIIADLQKQHGEDKVIVFTQNVDDLFERAGCSQVYHVHGEITKVRCLDNTSHIFDVGYNEVASTQKCEICGGKLKPAVIFFGEQAPMYRTQNQIFHNATEDDLIVVIGTSGQVVPVEFLFGHHPKILRGGKRILCNLDNKDPIRYELFDLCLFGRIIETIDTVELLVNDWFDDTIKLVF